MHLARRRQQRAGRAQGEPDEYMALTMSPVGLRMRLAERANA
jgi:hypothetical protein